MAANQSKPVKWYQIAFPGPGIVPPVWDDRITQTQRAGPSELWNHSIGDNTEPLWTLDPEKSSLRLFPVSTRILLLKEILDSMIFKVIHTAYYDNLLCFFFFSFLSFSAQMPFGDTLLQFSYLLLIYFLGLMRPEQLSILNLLISFAQFLARTRKPQ